MTALLEREAVDEDFLHSCASGNVRTKWATAYVHFYGDDYGDDSKGAKIYSVRVHNQHRGQGSGRRIMEKALRCARKKGATWVTLDVEADNTPAVHLYESLGFVRGRSFNRYSDDDFCRIVQHYRMTLDFTNPQQKG